MARARKYHRFSYFASSFTTVLGVVLIWRGLWYGLDFLDQHLFGGSHELTVLSGIVIGFLLLYIPDRSLEELRRL